MSVVVGRFFVVVVAIIIGGFLALTYILSSLLSLANYFTNMTSQYDTGDNPFSSSLSVLEGVRMWMAAVLGSVAAVALLLIISLLKDASEAEW